MEWLMVMESTNIIMVLYMRVIFSRIESREWVKRIILMGKVMRVNFTKIVKLREFIHSKMDLYMKVKLRTIKRMDWEF